MSMMMDRDHDPHATYATCPRCGQERLRIDRPALNALSRTDNKTYVCSDCGTSEGLEAMARGMANSSKGAWKAPQAATLFIGDD
jgi:predicted RNA-binding Zn-ribbon protein involved in translation (DUF1610 family)